MKRLAIIIVAVLLGAAAPARAWCEATCLAPVALGTDAAKSHCPVHEPASGTASIAAADSADCPVVESARPVVAKLDLKAPAHTIASHPAPSTPLHAGVREPARLSPPAPLHLTSTPLRI